MKNEQNGRILYYICLKITFPQILGAIPSYKSESERTRPHHQRDHGEHRFTGGRNRAK